VGIDDGPVFGSVRRCHGSFLNSWLEEARATETNETDSGIT